MNCGKFAQTVIGLDRGTAVTPRRGEQRLGLVLGVRLLRLHLGQLPGHFAKLVLHQGQFILTLLHELLRLGKQLGVLLVVAIQLDAFVDQPAVFGNQRLLILLHLLQLRLALWSKRIVLATGK